MNSSEVGLGGGGGGGRRLKKTKTFPCEKLDVQTKMLFKH